MTGLDNGGEARLLERGWHRAARWNTTAGQWLAYSSLTIGGVSQAGVGGFFAGRGFARPSPSKARPCWTSDAAFGSSGFFALPGEARSAVGVDSDASALEAAQLISGRLAAAPPRTDIVAGSSIAEWGDDRTALQLPFRGVRVHLRRARFDEGRARSPSWRRLSPHRHPGSNGVRPHPPPRHEVACSTRGNVASCGCGERGRVDKLGRLLNCADRQPRHSAAAPADRVERR